MSPSRSEVNISDTLMTRWRADELFHSQRARSQRNIHNFLLWLFPAQYLLLVYIAALLFPVPFIYPNVQATIVLGGLATSIPMVFIILWPGEQITCHAVAVSQILIGVLLVPLSGSRVETQFYVFGSLAFLAAYRNRKVLLTAAAVIAADQAIRVWWPNAIFTGDAERLARPLQQIGAVALETIVLSLAIGCALNELRALAYQQAQAEWSRMRDLSLPPVIDELRPAFRPATA